MFEGNTVEDDGKSGPELMFTCRVGSEEKASCPSPAPRKVQWCLQSGRYPATVFEDQGALNTLQQTCASKIVKERRCHCSLPTARGTTQPRAEGDGEPGQPWPPSRHPSARARPGAPPDPTPGRPQGIGLTRDINGHRSLTATCTHPSTRVGRGRPFISGR